MEEEDFTMSINTQCTICLSAVEGDKDRTVTCCNHVFHTSCIMKQVMLNQDNRCPNCRGEMFEPVASADSEDYMDEELTVEELAMLGIIPVEEHENEEHIDELSSEQLRFLEEAILSGDLIGSPRGVNEHSQAEFPDMYNLLSEIENEYSEIENEYYVSDYTESDYPESETETESERETMDETANINTSIATQTQVDITESSTQTMPVTPRNQMIICKQAKTPQKYNGHFLWGGNIGRTDGRKLF